MPSSAYDAWILDLDGTLYRPLGIKLIMAAQLALWGHDAIGVVRAFRREHERVRQSPVDDNESPFSVQVRRTAQACNRSPQEVERMVRDWMIARPARWLRWTQRGGLVREVRAFRARGGRTALVSDYPAREKLRAMGLHDVFEVVVANGEAGGPRALKPAPEGMLLAASQLGVAPSSCLVLGDRDDADGAAARAAGMAFRLIR